MSAHLRSHGLLPKPPATRWSTHYGEYNPEVKVRIVSSRVAYLYYTKNETNNGDHRKVVMLTWWDTFWHSKTLEQKIEEECIKLKKWIYDYNQRFVGRKNKSKELTQRMNEQI